jgi:hypothetical protein
LAKIIHPFSSQHKTASGQKHYPRHGRLGQAGMEGCRSDSSVKVDNRSIPLTQFAENYPVGFARHFAKLIMNKDPEDLLLSETAWAVSEQLSKKRRLTYKQQQEPAKEEADPNPPISDSYGQSLSWKSLSKAFQIATKRCGNTYFDRDHELTKSSAINARDADKFDHDMQRHRGIGFQTKVVLLRAVVTS